MSKKHKVKCFCWVNGILQWWERMFESLFDARSYADTEQHHHAKIYDERGVVVHTVVKTAHDPGPYA
jgi:hypothetical protein